VKTLLGSSGPVAVAQRASSTSLEASSKLLRLEQAGIESPTRVLLPALLASANVNIFLEGIVGALLQPIAHYPHWSTNGYSFIPSVFVNVHGPVVPPVAGEVPNCAYLHLCVFHCNGLSCST
jgi:hypothetical protein